MSPPLSARRTGVGSSGSTISPGATATRPITPTSGSPQPPAAPVSSSPGPSSGSGPGPQPKPTPVDAAVKIVTSVTEQVPGPVGPAATQAVQAAGSAADGVLSTIGSSSSAPAPSSTVTLALP